MHSQHVLITRHASAIQGIQEMAQIVSVRSNFIINKETLQCNTITLDMSNCICCSSCSMIKIYKKHDEKDNESIKTK